MNNFTSEYQELFNHMVEHHGLTLLQGEMDEIASLSKKLSDSSPWNRIEDKLPELSCKVEIWSESLQKKCSNLVITPARALFENGFHFLNPETEEFYKKNKISHWRYISPGPIPICKLSKYQSLLNNIDPKNLFSIYLLFISKPETHKNSKMIELDSLFNGNGQLVNAAEMLLDTRNLPIRFNTPKSWDIKIWQEICSKTYEDRVIIADTFLVAELDRMAELEKKIECIPTPPK